MRRYIATDGKMGYLPDTYVHIQAAKYLNCKPWELLDQPVWWIDTAIRYMTAEAQGQEIRAKHR